jgi:hypothetical protein
VLLFLFVVIVIYFYEKKERHNFCLLQYCSFTAVVMFKTIFLVELGIGLLFPKVKRRFEQG